MYSPHFPNLSQDYLRSCLLYTSIARSLCESAHLYLWDEPLNYLDVWSRMQIEQLLLAFQPTLLFVEHDETFRQTVATRQIELL